MSELKINDRVKINKKGREVLSKTPKPHTGTVKQTPRDKNLIGVLLDGRESVQVIAKSFVSKLPKTQQ